MKPDKILASSIPNNQIPFVIAQSNLIIENYMRCFGQPLINGSDDDVELASLMFNATFPIASANSLSDPILNYGNQCALDLWEVSWPQFTQLPGRKTAENTERIKREEFLETVRRQGYVDDYEGIRISSTGKRFKITGAKVWNLLGDGEQYLGQAATFKDWELLQD